MERLISKEWNQFLSLRVQFKSINERTEMAFYLIPYHVNFLLMFLRAFMISAFIAFAYDLRRYFNLM